MECQPYNKNPRRNQKERGGKDKRSRGINKVAAEVIGTSEQKARGIHKSISRLRVRTKEEESSEERGDSEEGGAS